MGVDSLSVDLSPEGRLLFGAKAVRTFGFGWLSVVLALHLSGLGFSTAEIGAVFTATLVEDALLTMALSVMASRIGPVRVMLVTAPLITFGGLLLAMAESRALLFLGAVLGILSRAVRRLAPSPPWSRRSSLAW